jgi:hypothetical protein
MLSAANMLCSAGDGGDQGAHVLYLTGMMLSAPHPRPRAPHTTPCPVPSRPSHHTHQVKDVVAAKAAGVDIELADVTELLKKAAAAYRSLYSSASAAGFDIPYEANLANLGGLVWVEQMMVGGCMAGWGRQGQGQGGPWGQGHGVGGAGDGEGGGGGEGRQLRGAVVVLVAQGCIPSGRTTFTCCALASFPLFDTASPLFHSVST